MLGDRRQKLYRQNLSALAYHRRVIRSLSSRVAIVASLATVVLMAAGCGGDSEPKDAAKAPMSEEEFGRAAQAICRDLPVRDAWEDFAVDMADRADQMAALDPPPAGEELIRLTRDAARYANRVGPIGESYSENLEPTLQDLEFAARRLGARSCSPFG